MKLTDQKPEKKNRIFIPEESEIEMIAFLNCLPRVSYDFFPEENELLFDFDILKKSDIPFNGDMKVTYNGKEYNMKDFVDLFENEVSFYLQLD